MPRPMMPTPDQRSTDVTAIIFAWSAFIEGRSRSAKRWRMVNVKSSAAARKYTFNRNALLP